ncbi:hypothetical protein B0O99DRAFT_582222, partial [Bisporella sp. PMI_857]
MNGECNSIKKYNTGYHLAINILSTLLLGSSNYIMQCLSAPTRAEIDKAHMKGIWLDIGIPSLKNLKLIGQKRLILWIFLGVSSWPLHLFYNSAVFATLHAHSYDIYTVRGDFLRVDALDKIPSEEWDSFGKFDMDELHRRAMNGSLARMSSAECIEEFAQPFQTRNDVVLLVLNAPPIESARPITIKHQLLSMPPTENLSGERCPAAVDNLSWLCDNINTDQCNTFCKTLLPELKANSTWAPFGESVDHCLVNRAEQQCTLQFSMPIMIIVIVMNACKMMIVGFVALNLKTTPVITLGDAIESFLTRPDIAERPSISRIDNEIPRLKTSRYTAVSVRRWTTCILVCLGATIFVGAWFIYAYSETRDVENAFKLGFGVTDPRTLIMGWGVPSYGTAGVIWNALMANLAQPFLSTVYFTYNSFMTAIVSATEWDGYARFRKGLRVSGIPRGAQRVTHFLQLPYRYSIPLMVFSTLLHWLISQSIFVVSVVTDPKNNSAGTDTENYDFITCGYSLTPMAVTFGLGFLFIVSAVIVGMSRLRSNIPICFNNSKLIANECHPDPFRENEAYRRLQWGPRRNEDGSIQYAFSSVPIDHSISGDVGHLESRSLKQRIRLPGFRSYASLRSEDITLQELER